MCHYNVLGYYDIPGSRFFTIGDYNYTFLSTMELCHYGVIQDITEVWFIYHRQTSPNDVYCALPVGNSHAKIRHTTANRTAIIGSFQEACNGRRTCSPDTPLYTYNITNKLYKATVRCVFSAFVYPVYYNRVEYTCPGKVVIKQISDVFGYGISFRIDVTKLYFAVILRDYRHNKIYLFKEILAKENL